MNQPKNDKPESIWDNNDSQIEYTPIEYTKQIEYWYGNWQEPLNAKFAIKWITQQTSDWFLLMWA